MPEGSRNRRQQEGQCQPCTPHVLGYNSSAAVVVGVVEMLLGLGCIGAHVPQFTENVNGAIGSTGLWAGAFYFIVGAVTLASGRNATRSLVVATLCLSILAAVLSLIAVAVGWLFWMLSGIYSQYQDGDAIEYRMKVGTISNVSIMSISLLAFILFVTGSVLACAGLGCVCCKRQHTYQPTIAKHEYV